MPLPESPFFPMNKSLPAPICSHDVRGDVSFKPLKGEVSDFVVVKKVYKCFDVPPRPTVCASPVNERAHFMKNSVVYRFLVFLLVTVLVKFEHLTSKLIHVMQ